MDSSFFARFRTNLLTQRHNLVEWLHDAPEDEKRIRFGPAGEQAVQDHLQVLDIALEKAGNETLGVCEVCHDYIEPSRLEMDYTACVCLDHLSTEEKRRLESELEFSQKVQQSLLPQQAPDIPGLQLAAYSQPARIVGGDYFDFFQFRDGAPGLAIADAVDKGMPASLLMASLQAALRILVTENDSPAEVTRRLNSLFAHSTQLTNFVTLFLGRFDRPLRTLHYCNAGHNPPLLYRRSPDGAEQLQWLQPTGAAIGLVETSEFKTAQTALSPADTLLLYTDGVTEALNTQTEEFGSQRLVEFVRGQSTSSAAELMQGLRRSLQEFTAGQPLADDTTIIACKIER